MELLDAFADFDVLESKKTKQLVAVADYTPIRASFDDPIHQIDGSNIQSLRDAFQCYYCKGDYDLAYGVAQQMLSLDASNEIHLFAAMASRRLKKWTECAYHLTSAKLDASNSLAFRILQLYHIIIKEFIKTESKDEYGFADSVLNLMMHYYRDQNNVQPNILYSIGLAFLLCYRTDASPLHCYWTTTMLQYAISGYERQRVFDARKSTISPLQLAMKQNELDHCKSILLEIPIENTIGDNSLVYLWVQKLTDSSHTNNDALIEDKKSSVQFL